MKIPKCECPSGNESVEQEGKHFLSILFPLFGARGNGVTAPCFLEGKYEKEQRGREKAILIKMNVAEVAVAPKSRVLFCFPFIFVI